MSKPLNPGLFKLATDDGVPVVDLLHYQQILKSEKVAYQDLVDKTRLYRYNLPIAEDIPNIATTGNKDQSLAIIEQTLKIEKNASLCTTVPIIVREQTRLAEEMLRNIAGDGFSYAQVKVQAGKATEVKEQFKGVAIEDVEKYLTDFFRGFLNNIQFINVLTDYINDLLIGTPLLITTVHKSRVSGKNTDDTNDAVDVGVRIIPSDSVLIDSLTGYNGQPINFVWEEVLPVGVIQSSVYNSYHQGAFTKAEVDAFIEWQSKYKTADVKAAHNKDGYVKVTTFYLTEFYTSTGKKIEKRIVTVLNDNHLLGDEPFLKWNAGKPACYAGFFGKSDIGNRVYNHSPLHNMLSLQATANKTMNFALRELQHMGTWLTLPKGASSIVANVILAEDAQQPKISQSSSSGGLSAALTIMTECSRQAEQLSIGMQLDNAASMPSPRTATEMEAMNQRKTTQVGYLSQRLAATCLLPLLNTLLSLSVITIGAGGSSDTGLERMQRKITYTKGQSEGTLEVSALLSDDLFEVTLPNLNPQASDSARVAALMGFANAPPEQVLLHPEVFKNVLNLNGVPDADAYVDRTVEKLKMMTGVTPVNGGQNAEPQS